MTGVFAQRLKQNLPPPADANAAERFWDDLHSTHQTQLCPHKDFLKSLAGGSPYLRALMLRDPRFLAETLATSPEKLLDDICVGLRLAEQSPTQTEIMTALRHAKDKASLLIALADTGLLWNVDEVTANLTRFADAMLTATINWLLMDAARAGKFHLNNPGNPSQNCGYVALAMGKHGAGELNYSSDIDLIILYDPETAPLAEGTEPATFFVRMTKRLVTILQDVTEHGYGLRVDLRLRPDPRATQVAISMESAAVYYESMGQNWERAAMIKARPAAGDLTLGTEFLQRLKPYIWRKYLDFAAIADVQSLKRQIHAVKGHGTIAVLGHNIKLGRGGIREIEFFVQTQQLIAGGRNPLLRGLRTLDMLDALAEAGWIARAAAAGLKTAYRFLRTIEHRIQMVNDEQTHTLPKDEEAFESLARLSGYASSQAFSQDLRQTFELVQGHYAALFESATVLASAGGSLVFTGGEDDPETIETLAGMGFRQPSEISATIRGWHFGRYAATRSGKSKELLTELMPLLLSALARSGDADLAFLAFDRFIAGLPAGVQLFSMLKANPNLLDLIATILGTAPRLAEQLSARPRVLDAVLDPGFFGALPPPEAVKAIITSVIPEAVPLDEVIDRVRIIGREQMFRVGVRVLSETVSAVEAGSAFSTIAELLLQRLHSAVQQDMETRHGAVPGGRSCVVAMGKMGGCEMTAGSDLDLMLVYENAQGLEYSQGAKPLAVNQYFSRLTQRLITSITAPTSEGVLFEVDLRLRPSGNKGPVATSFESFVSYQKDSAWTWEKLALTRARLVSGDAQLGAALTQAITESLCAVRDAAVTRKDVLDMRRLMVKEQGSGGLWDIKRVRGGLVEIEFITQFLQLIHAAKNPTILDTNTHAALSKLAAANLLNASIAHDLKEACLLYHRITQVLRLCVSGAYNPAASPSGLNQIVARAAIVPDIKSAESLLADTQVRVAAIFDEIIGPVGI
jgi:[glutamine synthetase] adenylyltransferase / [glutamine synthetase]-adenylyl-L-tyrosine phosphorylase